MKALLYTDGGARGNPGPAGIGAVLTTPEGDLTGEVSRSLGHTTNNVAEYEAVIAGLELALERGVTEIDIRADSKLVVNQLRGEWKIKNDRLRGLAVNARRLMNLFEKARITHVRRAQNERADALANQAMDEAALVEELGGGESLF
ncbi:MAG: reverse transcriptase-like protein [Actinobacteria bacterium]|nr:reverse transcriptase-like protein [Actinomycetota bacterium]